MTCVSVEVVADMQRIQVTLDRRAIAYVRFIFEGYDGLGIVSAPEPHRALIQFPAGRQPEARALIRALQQEGAIKEVIEA